MGYVWQNNINHMYSHSMGHESHDIILKLVLYLYKVQLINLAATQEEAATAYDMAAIEYRGLNAVTNFDLSRYIKWLKPNNNNNDDNNKSNINLCDINSNSSANDSNSNEELEFSLVDNEISLNNSIDEATLVQPRPTSATSALELLLQSSKFKEMVEMASMTSNVSTTLESDQLSQCAFPDDIQTYFEYENFNDTMLEDLNSIMPTFHYDFEGAEVL